MNSTRVALLQLVALICLLPGLSGSVRNALDASPEPMLNEGLEQVWNCRDVAWGLGSGQVKAGRLARCGNPNNATLRDYQLIMSVLAPASLVDLRSREEIAADPVKSLMNLPRTHQELGDRNVLKAVLLARAGVDTLVAYATWRFVRGDVGRANAVMGKLLGGLAGLNRIMLQHEGPALNEALRAIVWSPAPVLVHCTAGKDRTGLVVALALAVAQVPQEEIVHEYSLSHKHREAIRTRAMHGVMADEEWSGANPAVLRDTFAFMAQQYGSVSQYLHSIGFDRAWQGKLAAKLTETQGSMLGRIL